MSSPLKLYTNGLCPFAMRAALALKEKGVQYEAETVPIPTPDWYREKINPFGGVPCLAVNGQHIPESMVLVYFAEENFKGQGTALLPADAVKAANIRLFVDQVGAFVGDLYGLLTAHSADDAKLAELKKGVQDDVDFLEGMIQQRGDATGPYLFGADPTVADVAIAPFLDRFRHTLMHYRQFNVLEKAPRLSTMLSAFEQRDSFKSVAMKGEEYIAAYEPYATGKR